MAAWSFTKIGTIFTSAQLPTYYPSIIDTSSIPNWPWTVTLYTSADHSAEGSSGIYMAGANGDPTNPANWETYATARAAGRFDAWAAATGEGLPNTGSRIFGTTLDQCETPCINKVGSYWYCSEHDQAGSIGTTNDQPTRMYKSTANGPLNFTLLSNGDDGKIINGLTSPGTTWPEGPAQTAHRGYFKWGPNKFRGFINPATNDPYEYIGFATCGGNLEAPRIMMGSDDGETWDHVRQIGPISGLEQTWGSVTFADTSTGYRISPRYTEFDVQAISDEINGEHYFLTGGRPSASADPGIYEGCFASDGFTETRARRLVIPVGGSGADDEDAIYGVSVIPWGGAYLAVYRSRNASLSNFLRIATATFTPSAAKAAPLAYPNHDKYTFDARGASALPAWLSVNSGTSAPTFSAAGMTTPDVPTPGMVLIGPTFDPATTDWAELYVHEAPGNLPEASSGIYIGFADTPVVTTSTEAVRIFSLSNDLPANLQYRVGSANTTVGDNAWVWRQTVGTTPSQAGRKHRHGLRWYIEQQKMSMLIGGRNRPGYASTQVDLSGYTQLSELQRPVIFTYNNAHTFEQIEFRVGTSGAGVRPTITTADATSTSAVTLTFDQDCIGDCTGITVKDGGSPVAGTWTRPTLTTAVFTRSSGTWSGALTYDISSTDIRNEADLVALADVTGAEISNDEVVVETGPSSKQVGIGGYTRTGRRGFNTVGGSVGS